MCRVAIVAPADRLRAMLLVIADAGVVQLVGPVAAPQGEAVEALRRVERHSSDVPEDARAPGPGTARLSVMPRPVTELERHGRRDLLAGEVELQRRAAGAVNRDGFATLVGWVPRHELTPLAEHLSAIGAAVVELPHPRLVEPPTLLRPARIVQPFEPLVATYGATRYADIDPTPFAAVSFVVMFGMMFGDVGHGLALAALGLLLRRSGSPRLTGVRPLWPFAVAAGLTAAVFGGLYGECFGPTGIVPALWLEPLDDPVQLLAAGIGVGALLLAISYGIGIVNRWRGAGVRAALLAPSGIAGLAVFLGVALAGLGVYQDSTAPLTVGAAVLVGGVALLFAGFLAEAGVSGTGVAESLIEVLDAVMRVGANLISFTRLAAFGLMHAALGLVVLDGARSLWESGRVGLAAGAAVFAVGNLAAFALEALVAGVQAMRLEYYELFSRVFAGEGEAFTPWRIPVVDPTEPA